MSLCERNATRSAVAILVTAFPLLFGCTEDETPPPNGSAGASGSAGATGGSGGSGPGSGGNGGSAGSAGSAGSGGSAGSAGTTGFTTTGVCGQRGEGTVSVTEFDGFEEYYLIGEEGFGEDICIVRYDTTRVGDPAEPCPDCEWSHLVELSNPTIIEDVNGVCENSQLGFGPDRLAELDGSRVAYGYVFEFAGHNSVVMKFFENRGMWDAFGNATWDEAQSLFDFDRRDGDCGYTEVP